MTAINSNRAIRGPVTAVPVVAGKGVRLVADTENNRIVAEADDTVLWSGNPTAASDDVTLSESVANFETIRVYANWKFNSTANIPCYIEIPSGIGQFSLNGFSTSNTTTQVTSQMQVYMVTGTYTISTTTIKPINIIRFQLTGASGNSASVGNISFTDTLKIYKVIGINRVASN